MAVSAETNENQQFLGVRYAREKQLYEDLVSDDLVGWALQKSAPQNPSFLGRLLRLGNALRISRKMAPELMEAVTVATKRANFTAPLEVFVVDGPLNASIFQDASGIVHLTFSSHFLKYFSPLEIQYVTGHELGHLLFGHNQLDADRLAMTADVLGEILSKDHALKLFLWKRWAEMSADRMGVWVCQNIDAALSAHQKIFIGPEMGSLQWDLLEQLEQASALSLVPRSPESSLWFDTYPFLTQRLLGISLCKNLPGFSAQGDVDIAASDKMETVMLGQMEPASANSENAALIRRLVAYAGITVASSDGEISSHEHAALRGMLEPGESHEDLDHDKSEALFREIFGQEGSKLSLLDKQTIVERLVVVATADGEVSTAESEQIEKISLMLEVAPQVAAEAITQYRQGLD